ncbi:hypothetical protein IMG5_114380, partial [Ichthyophthirius multifiliis]
GNAEDLGYSYEFLSFLRKNLKLNIIAVEYPGYGLYNGEANSEKIQQDALLVYDFVHKIMNVPNKNILVFGRSIGSGPACFLASQRIIGCLILMCPYTCIGDVVRDIIGPFGKFLVQDRFRNIDFIQKVSCDILFIHGKDDKLINFKHSIQLMQSCKGNAKMYLGEKMTHNEFLLQEDVIIPILEFFQDFNIQIEKTNNNISVPNRFYSKKN